MRSSDIKIILVICSSSNFRLQNIEITPCLPHHLKCPMVSWCWCWRLKLLEKFPGGGTDDWGVSSRNFNSLNLIKTVGDQWDGHWLRWWWWDGSVWWKLCVWVVWVSPYSVLCTHSTHSTLTDYHSSGNCRPQHTLQHCRHTHVTHTAVTSHQLSAPGDISQDEPSTGEIIE